MRLIKKIQIIAEHQVSTTPVSTTPLQNRQEIHLELRLQARAGTVRRPHSRQIVSQPARPQTHSRHTRLEGQGARPVRAAWIRSVGPCGHSCVGVEAENEDVGGKLWAIGLDVSRNFLSGHMMHCIRNAEAQATTNGKKTVLQARENRCEF
jgi:hypothetical protein